MNDGSAASAIVGGNSAGKWSSAPASFASRTSGPSQTPNELTADRAGLSPRVMSAMIRFAAAALLACIPSAAFADPAGLLALQNYDRQLSAIGYRLAMAGGDLCAAKVPIPGFALHDLSQYSAATQADARGAFGF